MNEFDENLLDRDLGEALGGDGPAPELKGRILSGLNPRTRRPSGRVLPLPVKRTPWGAYVAAAAALVVAVAAFGWAMTRPTEPVKPTPVSDRPAANTPVAPQANAAPVSPNQTPEPQDGGEQPTPRNPVPEPMPQPTPKPEPTPEPQPEKPDHVVEKPAPEPTPTPEKPDTQAPDEPSQRKVVATVSADAKLKIRALSNGEWLKLEGTEIEQGWQLKADAASDLVLSSGMRLRFEGELALKAGEIELGGRRTEVYLDALGVPGSLVLTREQLRLELSDSEAFIEASGSALEISCFEGKAGEVAAGRFGKLSPRGFSGLRDLKESELNPRLLKGMPPRRLYFNGLDAEPSGVARCKGENSQLSLKLDPAIAAVSGAAIRLRFKAANAGALYVQLQQTAGEKQWGKWTPLAGKDKNDWVEWTIPLAELQRDDGRSEAPMQPGDTFVNINLFIQDGKQAELELDWLEIVRIRKE